LSRSGGQTKLTANWLCVPPYHKALGLTQNRRKCGKSGSLKVSNCFLAFACPTARAELPVGMQGLCGTSLCILVSGTATCPLYFWYENAVPCNFCLFVLSEFLCWLYALYPPLSVVELVSRDISRALHLYVCGLNYAHVWISHWLSLQLVL
jgi:hypothetical protein